RESSRGMVDAGGVEQGMKVPGGVAQVEAGAVEALCDDRLAVDSGTAVGTEGPGSIVRHRFKEGGGMVRLTGEARGEGGSLGPKALHAQEPPPAGGEQDPDGLVLWPRHGARGGTGDEIPEPGGMLATYPIQGNQAAVAGIGDVREGRAGEGQQ